MSRKTLGHAVWRIVIILLAFLTLPPILLLALAPLLIVLAPVALVGIPFIVPAMLSGSLAARSEDRARASWLPRRRLVKAANQ